MNPIPLVLAGLAALLAVVGWLLHRRLLGVPAALTRLYLRRLERGDVTSLGRGGSSYYAHLAAGLLDSCGDADAGAQAPKRDGFRDLAADAPVQHGQLQQRLARQLEQLPRGALRLLLGLQALALLLLLTAGAWSLRSAFGLMAAEVDPFDPRFASEIVASAAAELPLALVAYNGFRLLRYPGQVRRGAGLLLPALERALERALSEPAATDDLPCRLLILAGPGEGTALHLDRPSMTLGRVEGADFIVSHRSLSRRHCRFTFAGDCFSVEDLGSANGVRVNGKEVTTFGLRPDDVIELGNVKLRYLVGTPPPMEEPALPPGRCPACGQDNALHFKWCMGCGAELPK